MASQAPTFFLDVRYIIDMAILFLTLVLLGVSFVHCLTQRSDGFPAIGTLPKGGWLAILGLCMLFSMLLYRQTIFQMIGIAAAMIYLLDVRVGLRDLTDGKGFW